MVVLHIRSMEVGVQYVDMVLDVHVVLDVHGVPDIHGVLDVYVVLNVGVVLDGDVVWDVHVIHKDVVVGLVEFEAMEQIRVKRL